MLIQWMGYAMLIAVLFALAATAVEQAAAMWGGARRYVWLAALAVAAVAPVLLSLRRPAPSATAPRANVPAADAGAVYEVQIPVHVMAAGPSLAQTVARRFDSADAYAGPVWIGVSLMLVAAFVRAALGLARRRRHWREIELAGERILVADDVGPAVVGTMRPRIVIPRWALSLDDTARHLMLRHESEHIRARDPQLLFAAALAIALFPWNPALWFIVRRLRLAVEMDCDARVLRAAPQPREYGLLLLTVGARHRAPIHLAASLAERRQFLERRIRAMTISRPNYPRLATTALVAIAVVATTAAARAPRPASLTRATATTPARPASVQKALAARATPGQPELREVPATVASPRVESAATNAPRSTPLSARSAPSRAKADSALTTAEIRALITEFYPSVLNGDESIGTITFVVDANHNYVMSQMARRDAAKMAEEERAGEIRQQLLREAIGGNGSAVGGGRGGRGGNAGLTEIPVGGMPVRSEQYAFAGDSEKVIAMKRMVEALQTKLAAAKVNGDDVDKAELDKMKAAYEYTMRGRDEKFAFGISIDSAKASEMAMEKAYADVDKARLIPSVVDPSTVGLIQTMKIGPGGWAPTGIAVVVVHLKP